MSKLTRHRLSAQRWRPLLAAEAEGAAWLESNREPLRRALARICYDELLTLHWLRLLLIYHCF